MLKSNPNEKANTSEFRRPPTIFSMLMSVVFIMGHSFVLSVLTWQLFRQGAESFLLPAFLVELLLTIFTFIITGMSYFIIRPMFDKNEELFTSLESQKHQLNDSRKVYQMIVEDQNDLICRFKPDGTLSFVNEAFCRYFRRQQADLIGTNIRSLLPAKDHQRLNSYLQSLTPPKPTRNIIYRVEPKPEKVIWQQWRIRAIYEGETIQEYQGIGQDITEQKAAEDTVLRTTARLQFLLSASPAVIYTTEAQGNYNPLFVSRNVENLFGHQQVLYWTSDRFWLNHIHPDDLALVLEKRAACERDAVLRQDYRFLHGDGHYIWVRDEFRVTMNESGEMVFIGAWVDITDRKSDEEALRLTRDAAESANRAKSSFLATMSHELRTPLNAILGFTQLILAEDQLEVQTRQHLQTISRSGQHLLELINDILEMSRIEAGRVTLNNHPFNLRKLIMDIEDLLRLKAEEKDLELRFVGVKRLPQFVEADESKLRQILLNLLSNAIKFTKKGFVELRFHYNNLSTQALSEKPRGRILIEVQDSGAGIAEDELAILFQPFAQTLTGKRLQEGTGLGLAISREFVRLMGGDIAVYSVPNQGTTFSADIVVTESANMESEVPISNSPTALRLVANQKGLRILVVEDEANSRELIIRTLESAGFHVQAVDNGREAVELTHIWQPHLVFMDLNMPILDGLSATREIRKENQEVKIIALSASVFDKEGFLEAGCNDFITKPFNRPVLFLKLQEHLGVVFEGFSPAQAAQKSRKLGTDQLLKIPRHYLEQLKHAATMLDMQAAQEVTAAIQQFDPDIAEKLSEMINNFRFDLLQHLIEGMEKNT